MATPLLLCLCVIELSDVVFAVDSIPAVFGVTQDPLIVYSSNIFAILGLRSLYAFVAQMVAELEYLQTAVAAVLGFVGCKMVAGFGGYEISTEASLAVVVVSISQSPHSASLVAHTRLTFHFLQSGDAGRGRRAVAVQEGRRRDGDGEVMRPGWSMKCAYI
jgi:predicted tellurium resistance membrane protein TerC|tara:strand:- start:682 stop:1164 length:483 start_codon:yes stop_codon:yes gene_type:complete